MDQFLNKVLRPYWLALFVMAVGLLSLYTSSPIYGAPAATPTPDVQTVPKPIIVDTPTNTPFPTPTPDGNSNAPGGGGPIATRPPSNNQGNDDNDNNDDDNNDDNNNNQNNNQPNTPAPTQSTAGNGAATTPVANATPGNGTQTTGATGGLTGIVNVVTLNIRKGPSTSEHIIDTLFMHDQVVVSGRDRAGAWWYVCCGAGSKRAGWVSARFITPSFASTEAATLLPVLGNGPAPVATQNDKATPQASGTPQATGTPATVTTPATGATTPLVMTMRAQPAFAWQGQRIQLQLTLRNGGTQALTTLHLRNDLPPELAFVEATISDGGAYSYQGDANSGPLLTIDWPSLPAGAQVTAMLTLQIRSDTPIGALIDNLAVVTSAEGDEALAGLTLAMPPTGLPQFR